MIQITLLVWAAFGLAVLWQTRFRVMAVVALTTCTAVAVVGLLVLPLVAATFDSLP